MRVIPEAAVLFLKRHEIYVGRVYDDARPDKIVERGDEIKGTLTAAWGHTGPGLVIGMTVTPEMGEAWLRADMQEAVDRLYRLVKPGIIAQLTDAQWAALICFVFNVGGGDPAKPWGIWKVLNAAQFDQVPLRMAQYVNVRIDGQLVKESGLVARRAAEVAMWSVDEPGSIFAPTSSSITRRIDTPPTPLDGVPLSRSKMALAASGAIATALPGVIEHLAALAQNASLWASVAAVAAVAALGLSVAALYFVVAHKRLSQS